MGGTRSASPASSVTGDCNRGGIGSPRFGFAAPNHPGATQSAFRSCRAEACRLGSQRRVSPRRDRPRRPPCSPEGRRQVPQPAVRRRRRSRSRPRSPSGRAGSKACLAPSSRRVCRCPATPGASHGCSESPPWRCWPSPPARSSPTSSPSSAARALSRRGKAATVLNTFRGSERSVRKANRIRRSGPRGSRGRGAERARLARTLRRR